MKYFSLKNKFLIFVCLLTMFNSLSIAYGAEESFTLLGAATLAPVSNTNTDIFVVVSSENGKAELHSDSKESARVIKELPNEYSLTVLGSEYGWIYVEDDDDNRGYIKASELTFKNGEKTDNSILFPTLAHKIVEYSKNFIGTPYVWGGTNLENGVDCSGLIYSCYRKFGVSISRTSRSMYENDGYSISKDELKEGDLIFFNTLGNGVSHVGMYIGDGKYINAMDNGVCIQDINSSYSLRTYIGCKRVLN